MESNTLTSLPCYLFVYKNFQKIQNDFMFSNIMTWGDILVSDLIETTFLEARQFPQYTIVCMYEAPSVKSDTLF